MSLKIAQFFGYHSHRREELFYALLPSPDGACNLLSDAFQSLTFCASHEVAQAITDPIPGKSWYFFEDKVFQGEIADFCAFDQDLRPNTNILNGFVVQKLFSNRFHNCL